MKDMAQIDHSKNNEMSAQEESILTIEPYQQGFEFINPSKSSFTSETMFVNLSIEKSFATSFGNLTVTEIMTHIGNYPMIEAGFSGFLCVESLIGIEESTRDAKF